MVQAWYQGGISVWDFTDSRQARRRSPTGSAVRCRPTALVGGGSWSAYYYNGYIYSNDIVKGFDVLKLNDWRTWTANLTATASSTCRPSPATWAGRHRRTTPGPAPRSLGAGPGRVRAGTPGLSGSPHRATSSARPCSPGDGGAGHDGGASAGGRPDVMRTWSDVKLAAVADAPPAPPEPTRRWRPHPLDLVAVVLAVVGAACALSGLLPRAETTATLHRILPLLLFLGTVIVLAELTAVAGVFDVLATRLAIAARGRWAALFLLCVGLRRGDHRSCSTSTPPRCCSPRSARAGRAAARARRCRSR